MNTRKTTIKTLVEHTLLEIASSVATPQPRVQRKPVQKPSPGIDVPYKWKSDEFSEYEGITDSMLTRPLLKAGKGSVNIPAQIMKKGHGLGSKIGGDVGGGVGRDVGSGLGSVVGGGLGGAVLGSSLEKAGKAVGSFVGGAAGSVLGPIVTPPKQVAASAGSAVKDLLVTNVKSALSATVPGQLAHWMMKKQDEASAKDFNLRQEREFKARQEGGKLMADTQARIQSQQQAQKASEKERAMRLGLPWTDEYGTVHNV